MRRAVAPVQALSDDALDSIHQAAFRILEELGIEFLSERALELFASAGADVDRERGLARLPRALVEETLKKAPSRFTLTPRNQTRKIGVGGDALAFGFVAGPPNVEDRINGRRAGNIADYRRLIQLAQSFDIIHFLGNQPTAPQDLPAQTRHLDCYLANLIYSDKIFHLSAIGRDRALDGIDMMAIARGLSRTELRESPGVITIVSVNSPRRFDAEMAEGLMTMAEWGQPIVVTPFTLMGAMAPVTIAGALAEQHAEAMAGLVLAQLVRPGTPVVYGAFTSNVDMKSGAPAFGTPENAKATVAAGQLARRLNLPYRASNASASNAFDAQAAYESQMSLWAAILGGANLVYHGAGWMEGGLTASFEKIVLDAEMLGAMAATVRPFAIEGEPEHEPAGNLGIFRALPGDAATRATAAWQRILAEYQPPPLDPAAEAALLAFVARRKEELIKAGSA